jgi:hypothetical protein
MQAATKLSKCSLEGNMEGMIYFSDITGTICNLVMWVHAEMVYSELLPPALTMFPDLLAEEPADTETQKSTPDDKPQQKEIAPEQNTDGGFSFHAHANELKENIASTDMLSKRLSTSSKTLGEVTASLALCVDKLCLRIGKSFLEKLEQSLVPENTGAICTSNSLHMQELIEYVRLCGCLLLSPKLCDLPIDSISVDDQRVEALENFARLHAKYISGHRCDIVIDTSLGEPTVVEDLNIISGKVTQKIGAPISSLHVDGCILTWTDLIWKRKICLNVVHYLVLEKTSPDAALKLMITEPTIESLVISEAENFFVTAKGEHVFDNAAYNKAKTLLHKFAGASQMTHMDLQAAVLSSPSEGDRRLPVEHANMIMNVECIIQDMCSLAATLQSLGFLNDNSETNKTALTAEKLDGPVANAISIMMALNLKLDCSSRCQTALDIESTGIILTKPFHLVREWSQSVAAFSKICVTQLLKSFVSVLETALDHCGKVIPEWEACFNTNGEFMEELAVKIVKGKLPIVIKAHNTVHSILAAMNSSGKKLEIVPKLKFHDETSKTIAIALTKLGKASTSSVFIHGVEILSTGRTDPHGPQKAGHFLDTNHNDMHTSIPASFWAELLLLKQHSSYTAMGPGQVQTVKLELSETKEVKQECVGLKRPPILMQSASSSSRSVVGSAKNESPSSKPKLALKRFKKSM